MFQRAMVAGCAGLVLFIGTAYGALTPEQYVCQKTVAKQGRVYFKKRFKALSKCENSINSGKLPTTTDCALEPKTAEKITKAEDSLTSKVTGACSDSVTASLDFGGECFGVVAGTALASCQIAEHAAASDDLIETAYGDIDPPNVCVGGTNAGRGANLGWPVMEGDRPFAGSEPPVGSTQPLFTYGRDGGACTVIGGYVYRGLRIEELQGAYLFTDYCDGRLRAIRVSGGQTVDERMFDDLEGSELVSFGTDAAGEVYVVSLEGTIFRLDPA